MKQKWIVLLAALMLALCLTGCGQTSGTCGDNATWRMDVWGNLTIEGAGEVVSGGWDTGKVRTVTLGEGVTSIGGYHSIFENCPNLTKIHFPASMTELEYFYYGSYPKLSSIEVDENNPAYSSADGVLFNKDQTELLCAPERLSGQYRVPEGVTSIELSAFDDCSRLTKIDLPASVTHIGTGAFSGCSGLKEIQIPEGLTIIDELAFKGCESLKEIRLPASVTSIDRGAFNLCRRLTKVYLSVGLTKLGEGVFLSCENLESIQVDEKNPVFSSVDGVLFNKDQTELMIAPENLSGEYRVPDGVTSIGDEAFEGCHSLTAIQLPDGVTSIGDHAFAYCFSLTAVQLPDSVTSIGGYAFWDCYSLTAIQLPDGVTSIGDFAFACCSNITEIHIPASVTSIGDRAIELCADDCTIYAPEGSYAQTYAQENGFSFQAE